MSLARSGGERPDADDGAAGELRRIYEGFAEGFDTPDLKEARALLAELNGAVPPHS